MKNLTPWREVHTSSVSDVRTGIALRQVGINLRLLVQEADENLQALDGRIVSLEADSHTHAAQAAIANQQVNEDDAYVVSGATIPAANGLFTRYGEIQDENGLFRHPYYSNSSWVLYVEYYAGEHFWILNNRLQGAKASGYWDSGNGHTSIGQISGTYTPRGTATGNPTVRTANAYKVNAILDALRATGQIAT